jgi:chemotaxis protein methyltransferase CheR
LETRPATEILSPSEFGRITDLAWRTCGIDLKNGKRELVQARLGKKIRQGRFGSFKDYYDHVVADSTGEELIGLLDALTTNFTSFLREAAHFDLLRKTIIPGISGQIRIWSAACSTGEEPWSIAFSLLEELGPSAADRIRIVASDISSRALAIAERGAYEAERFRDLPKDWPSKYLLRGSDRWEGWFRVKPFIRRMVEFRRLNLMETLQPQRPFHVIFCRNVMIYFDKDTQEQLVNRFARCLDPGGYLLTGHSESLTGLKHPFQYVAPSVYRSVQAAGGSAEKGGPRSFAAILTSDS